MKNNKKNISAFTLIELLVAMTIFGIIMVSAIQIYLHTTQSGIKADLTRHMQENIKNISETMAEDLRKGRIGFYKEEVIGNTCIRENDKFFSGSPKKIISLDKICVGKIYSTPEKIEDFSSYYLGIKDSTNDSFKKVDENEAKECGKIVGGNYKQCYLLKKVGTGKPFPISNNLVNIKDLSFRVFPGSNYYTTVNFTIEPTKKGGVTPDILAETRINFQTSFSERFVEIQ